MLRRIAVFAGQAELVSPDEVAAALQVGRLLGENAITLVFDSSATGMIATVADTTVQSGGRLLGIRLGNHAAARSDLAEDRMARSIDEWREEIGKLSDAFIALPGGFQSLGEAFELWHWGGGSADRPLGLLDQGGYYSALLKEASDDAVDRFVIESQRGQLVVGTSATELLRRLADYRAPEGRRE